MPRIAPDFLGWPLLFHGNLAAMSPKNRILAVAVAASCVVTILSGIALGQRFTTKPPTAVDWAALAKLPDFTGVWERGGGGGARGARGAAPARPAYTPEYEAKRRAFQAAAPEDSETANCLPPGMPGIMTQPYPMEFLLTPGKVTIVIEAYTQVRHIYTDGRSLPADPDPEFHGTSVGRWEGDTLVVETMGFSPLTFIERGVPHSGKMRILERFRLSDADTMTIETTITDPVALTAPWTSSSTLRRHRDWTIAEYICEENNRNFVDSGGKAGVILTLPGAQAPQKD
jgi:hypothetical protein